MKVVALILVMIMSPVVLANSCKSEQNSLIANYEMNTSYQSGKSKKIDFTFIRKTENYILYQYPGNKISKSWFRASNGNISSVHYFEDFNRAIEYDRGDLAPDMSQDWMGMYPMISQNFLNSMGSKKVTDKCEVTYNHKEDKKTWKIVWSETLNLPIEMEHTNANKKFTLVLNAFKNDINSVNKTFARLNEFQATDYADIGDNESDPFLRKMIRLGFVNHGASGFYDSNGNALKSHDHHAH